MTHNDVLRSIRYLLNVSDAKLVEITALSGLEITRSDAVAFLKKEEEDGFEACPHLVMAHFLNGLITFKRGVDKTKPPQALESPVTNNTVLKKLRAAFELRDTDLIAMIEAAGLKASKTELSAFFRKKGHRNYRECGDQFLRAVLKGLTP